MKHVSIIIPKGHFSITNVDATHHVLSWVNEHAQNMGMEKPFDLHLVGLSKDTTQSTGLYTVHPDLVIQEVDQTDLIIIPAIHGDVQENVRLNTALIPWMKDQYEKGAEIASMCVGSFFLAAIGLLDGVPCSTHWQMADQFRQLFPEAIMMDDKILTDSSGIYTSGGAFSFTNLVIYLVEKYAGREMAVMAAKAFMIDIDRYSQSPFTIFSGQKTHDDAAVLQAQDYIESHFSEKLGVNSLCEEIGVGRRTIERRFKYATSNTIAEYIQRVKIEAAKKELESGNKTVSEVMYDVGYNDTKAFRNMFKKYAGLTPLEYRNKYCKAIDNLV